MADSRHNVPSIRARCPSMLRAAAWLQLFSLSAFSLSAAAPAATPSAVVAAVESTRVADLVLLDRGYDAGLRAGMVCRISRGTTEVAEVLLVELRPTCSSALILTLGPKQSIRAGDIASVKLQKS